MSLSGHRPVPRRKSSGGNLLNAFTSSKPPPISFQSPPPSSSAGPSSRQPPTPTQPRRSNSGGGDQDSDTMSVASLSVGLPPHSAGHSGSSGGGSVNGASLDAERLTQESFARRCEWIRYLKNAHEGSLYFAGTFLLQVDALSRCLDPAKMKARANSYALLGMSISNLLEIPVAPDFVKALTRLLDEYDALAGGRDEVAGSGGGGGAKMKNMFKAASKNGKRPSGGAGMEYATGLGGSGESGESSYLLTPNQPFALHYFQVLPTFFDILMKVYIKLHLFLWGTYPQRAAASSSQLDALPLPLSQQLAQRDADIKAQMELEWAAQDAAEAAGRPMSNPAPPNAASGRGAGGGVGTKGQPPPPMPVSPPRVPIPPRGAMGGSSGSLGFSGGGGGGSTTPLYTPLAASHPPTSAPPPLTSTHRTFADSERDAPRTGDFWKELGEPVQKIDARFKKIFIRLEAELESVHKRLVREELSTLESLLTSDSAQPDLFMPASGKGGLTPKAQWFLETDSCFAMGLGERARLERERRWEDEGAGAAGGMGGQGVGLGLGEGEMLARPVDQGGKGSNASAWDEGESLSFDRAVFA